MENKETDILRTEILKLKEMTKALSKALFSVLPLPDKDRIEDVTVVMGVKNRVDSRIENALKSIRSQDYPQNLMKIIVVDYGSRIRYMMPLKNLCKTYGAQYIRTRPTTFWNRGHCLNIGIKTAGTKYVLTSDVDIVFEKNYVGEAIKELQKNPYQVISCDILDLTENQKTDNIDVIKNYSLLKGKSKNRQDLMNCYGKNIFGMGITMALKHFFAEISGYDENYSIYGSEDQDLAERLELLGLEIKNISDRTSYLHQYHPKFEGLSEDEKKQIEKNKEYKNKAYNIKRNLSGWGELP